LNTPGNQAAVVWQFEHCVNPVVDICPALTGVQLSPVNAWQLVQEVSPVWFIGGVIAQLVPMVWQLPQVLLVDIGATVCALVPLAGRPVAVVPLWQVVQSVVRVTPV
jgi:hypothetical protein